MRKFSFKAFVESRFPLAILAGILLALAFPKPGVAGFGWIAPGAMIAAAVGTRGKASFRIGYVAGLTHYLVSLYWLLLIPYRWHGIPLGPMAGWLALSAFLALFMAAWVWLAIKLSGAAAPASPSAGQKEHSGPGWFQRNVWALVCAAAWAAMEMVIARIFGGFPWNLLGTSQYRITPLIQIASITGVYGVSFLMVWSSASLFNAVMAVLRRPTARSAWFAEIILPVIVVLGVFAFGLRRLDNAPEPARELAVTLVQPSIPQTLIWDAANDAERFQNLLRLSEDALTNHTDVLIWPEAGVPEFLRYHRETFQAVTNLARSHEVWMIIGSDDLEPGDNPDDPRDVKVFNSSFLISPEGELVARYQKRSLVIFGEYVPLKRWLPFMKWFTPVQSGFTPGKQSAKFVMPDMRATASPLICFEDTFPGDARSAAAPDVDLLVNLTNNGWFGESAAQWQHASAAVFRAVENGLPLVRCTNNGLTCWIDANGRLRRIFFDQRGTVYGPGFMTAKIPLAAPGERRRLTRYNRHGDVFGWSCVAVTGLMLIAQIRGWKPRHGRSRR